MTKLRITRTVEVTYEVNLDSYGCSLAEAIKYEKELEPEEAFEQLRVAVESAEGDDDIKQTVEVQVLDGNPG